MAKDAKKGPLFKGVQPSDLLSDEDIARLEGEVRDEINAEAKEAAEKEFKAKARKTAREAKGLDEAQVSVTIDLAPYADRLLIDNRAYLQGQTYTVAQSVAAVLLEQAQRTWSHQSQIDGKSENFYRKARGAHIQPNGSVVNTSQIMRA
jgi:hypothetical protein